MERNQHDTAGRGAAEAPGSDRPEETKLESALARTMGPNTTKEPDDWALARRGDGAAFERLYRDNVARIHSLARRLAGAPAADDLTQEVFIRAWQKLGTFRGDAAFSTWLHRLAVNLILSRRETMRRRESRTVAGDGLLDRFRARRARPDVAMDLERATGTLPEGAREVFVLYDVEGYTHAEIAELLGVSVGTSKSQLHRARMLLREQLG